MTGERAQAEYEALRATIRERGTRRVTLCWMSLAVWAALLLVAAVRGAGPFAVLVSLVALVAGFEAVYALQVGVERIGRYVQVFYEEPGILPAWERMAMAYGQEPSGDRVDPIFSNLFAAAAFLNLAPLVVSRQVGPILVALLGHGLFALRIWQARKYVSSQRARELEKFRKLKDKAGSL